MWFSYGLFVYPNRPFSFFRITVNIAVKCFGIQISLMLYYFNIPITQTKSVFPLNQMLYFYPQFLVLLNFFVVSKNLDSTMMQLPFVYGNTMQVKSKSEVCRLHTNVT